ncbi:MAG: copper amine oxidase [Clostridiaceae bacterium]|nr:copper amine oxidase [Clostridiaceae bacterium]
MKLKIKSFVLGVIVTLLVIAAIQPIIAEVTRKQITVDTGVNIYLNDIKLNPKDPNGNPVDVFIYNGTTYVPVRAISEALNVAVFWDGKTRSVYLGKHDTDVPSVMLYDLDYFKKDVGFVKEKSVMDNIGNSYINVLKVSHRFSDYTMEEYLINGKYRRLKGRFILDYKTRNTEEKAQILIYGDDRLIYTSPQMTSGTFPIDFDIDIDGVIRLKIEMIYNYKMIAHDNFYLVNCGLYQ